MPKSSRRCSRKMRGGYNPYMDIKRTSLNSKSRSRKSKSRSYRKSKSTILV